MITSLVDIINVIMEQNFFTFNGDCYKMTDGLPMGSPMSAILAEIYMNNLEIKINEHPIHRNNILIWNRYVDDIFTLWNEDAPLDPFLQYIK